MSFDPTSVRRRNKFAPIVESLTVRARNALHAVGVDLYTATRHDVQAGALRDLETHVRGCGETTRMELIALRKRLSDTTETQFWAVTVSRNGDEIVTIETNCLSGRDLSDEDKRVIRMAAEHLSAFIGPERTPEDEPFFPCDHDYVWVQQTVLNGTQYRCDLCGHVKWERDPIASAVRAELQPLEDALIDAGHKLAKTPAENESA